MHDALLFTFRIVAITGIGWMALKAGRIVAAILNECMVDDEEWHERDYC